MQILDLQARKLHGGNALMLFICNQPEIYFSPFRKTDFYVLYSQLIGIAKNE